MARSRGQSNPAGALAAILGSFKGGGAKISLKPEDPETQAKREALASINLLAPQLARKRVGATRAELEQPAFGQVIAPIEQQERLGLQQQFGLLPKPQKSIGEQIIEAEELAGARARGTASVKFSERAKTDFARIGAFEGSLNELIQASSGVPKGPIRGRFASGIAALTGGGGGLGIGKETAENVDLYNSLRPGIAAGLYRAVTGDDRISDIDAERRALPFVPPLSRTPGASEKRFLVLQRAIQKRKQGIMDAQRLGLESPPLGSSDFISLMKSSEREVRPPSEQVDIPSFQTEAEAEAANLAPGTTVRIRGRLAEVQ